MGARRESNAIGAAIKFLVGAFPPGVVAGTRNSLLKKAGLL
jgi:hypothetical protein